MHMRFLRTITTILLVCILCTGCGMRGNSGNESEMTGSSALSSAEESVQSSAEPEEPELFIENISNNQEGHYTFNPHVFGSRYLEEFGEEMRNTYFAFCDALRNGDDTFQCPDPDMLGWCTGRLSYFFFLPAVPYVTAGDWKDGVAEINYLIPKEEFLEKEKEFEETIMGIINDCVSDDYSDLEKILALYEYMTTNYTYDYEMYEHTLDWMDKQSGYRCLNEKQGICNEIAALYNYMLLQVGIDSEEMGGFSKPDDGSDGDGHSWVFVTLNGKSYHIDPTYGLTTDLAPLSYFMMTDEIREERDCYPRESLSLAAYGDQTREFISFEAVSDDFSELWEGEYIGMDRSSKEIVYRAYDDNYDEVIKRFSYAGLE